MSMFKKLAAWWSNSLFGSATIIDDITQRTHKATADAMACDAHIERARYQRHMALSELQALEAWNHQSNVLEKL